MDRDDLKDLEDIARMGGNGPLKDYLESQLVGSPQGGEPLPQIKDRDEHRSNNEISTPPSQKDLPVTDSRFTVFFQWLAGITGVLVATGIIWIAQVSVSTARKVDVLLDRPTPVPMSQYSSDREQTMQSLRTIDLRVKAIEDRQIETLMKYRQ